MSKTQLIGGENQGDDNRPTSAEGVGDRPRRHFKMREYQSLVRSVNPGISRKQIAAALKVSESTYRRWVSGSVPTPDWLIDRVLGVAR